MLDGPLILPPVLLAGLLTLSGVAKLAAPEDARSAFQELQLPRRLTRSPAPRLLPWGEIVLAVLLVTAPPPAALVVAGLALLLCLAYLGVVVRALGFDHPVTCGCFGRLGLGEVTRRTAARNVLLVLLAALTVWSATSTDSALVRLLAAPAPTWGWLALSALTAALLLLTLDGTTKAPVPSVADEEYAATPLPFASLVDASGRTLPLTELVREGAHLLVFVSTSCASCAEAVASLPEWDRRLGPVRVSAVTWRPVADVLEEQPHLTGLLLQDPEATTSRIFDVATPGAVLLGMDRTLAGGPVEGAAQVRSFIEDVRAELLDAGLLQDRADTPARGSAPVGE